MQTDKQIYLIFQAEPQWVFELAGEQSPGPCRFESITFKAIEKRTDGVLIATDKDGPLTVLEVQGYSDPLIYSRTVLEMAMLQQQYPDREIRGIILFLDDSLDLKKKPWRDIVRSVSLKGAIGELEECDPTHPLVSVFRPLLADSQEILERDAAPCYNWIKTSSIAESAKAVLLDVFLNWLEQRLNHKGKKEIEEMLIGQLPDLRETQSGKDLIAIGRSEGKNEGKLEGKLEGKIEGKIEGLIELLEIRFGEIPKPLRDELLQIKSIVAVDALYKKALAISSLRDFSCR